MCMHVCIHLCVQVEAYICVYSCGDQRSAFTEDTSLTEPSSPPLRAHCSSLRAWSQLLRMTFVVHCDLPVLVSLTSLPGSCSRNSGALSYWAALIFLKMPIRDFMSFKQLFCSSLPATLDPFKARCWGSVSATQGIATFCLPGLCCLPFSFPH